MQFLCNSKILFNCYYASQILHFNSFEGAMSGMDNWLCFLQKRNGEIEAVNNTL